MPTPPPPPPFDRPQAPPRTLPLPTPTSPEAFRSLDRSTGTDSDAEKSRLLSDAVGNVPTGWRVSSWLISVALHVGLAIILALIFFPAPRRPVVEAIFSTEIGDQLDFFTEDEGNLNPNEAEQYALDVPQELKIEDAVVFEKEELPFVPNVDAPFFEQSRVEMTDALSGRVDPGTKNDLIAKYGGNQRTQEAVAAGLAWLEKQQRRNGSWSLQGPYSDGVSSNMPDNPVAATGLALLAFQGDGNTRTEGEYAANVRSGWTWLLKQQRDDGCFTPDGVTAESLFYTHAVCTIGICELLAMEKGANVPLRRKARQAVDFLLENQHPKLGGWKYVPGVGSDLSVTGWCLMALKTAQAAKIEIPASHFERVSKFLDSVQYDDGAGYVYEVDKRGRISDVNKRPSMTATGLLCREYLGWERDNPALERGAQTLTLPEFLVRFPQSKEEEKAFYSNVYGWYSTSMALKHLGPYDKYWRRWNAALSAELPKRQEPKTSKEAGSWNPKYDEYNFGGGRLYVTTLSILCLEVYYRHLAIYRD